MRLVLQSEPARLEIEFRVRHWPLHLPDKYFWLRSADNVPPILPMQYAPVLRVLPSLPPVSHLQPRSFGFRNRQKLSLAKERARLPEQADQWHFAQPSKAVLGLLGGW